MPSDKAPGPNGFTGAFYKSSWSIIKPDIMAAIQAFVQADHRSLARLSNALIVLLPKKIGATTPNDFRLIPMIHSFTKLASKILTLKLAARLDSLVARNQNAFIRNRSIQDNFKYIQ